MKDIIVSIIVPILFFIGIFLMGYNNAKNYIPIEIKYDTIVVHVPDSSLMEVNDSLCYVIDSLNLNIEKKNDELSITKFKLERIREYNRIAGTGDNIIFLRGWINRVLDE